MFCVFVVLAVHGTAVFYEWYTSLWWWIDVVLHTAGGAWIALVFFYTDQRYVLQFHRLPPFFTLVLAAGFVMLMGVGWEWFEYGFDYFFAREHMAWRAQLGLPDTMGDLFADFAGGVLMSTYFILKNSFYTIKKQG